MQLFQTYCPVISSIHAVMVVGYVSHREGSIKFLAHSDVF